MKKDKKLEERREVWIKIAKTVFGILFCIGVVGIVVKPDSRQAMLVLAASGGAINILQGMQLYQKPKQQNQGMSMLMLGAVILVLGVWLFFSM